MQKNNRLAQSLQPWFFAMVPTLRIGVDNRHATQLFACKDRPDYVLPLRLEQATIWITVSDALYECSVTAKPGVLFAAM